MLVGCLAVSSVLGVGAYLAFAYLAPLVVLESAASSALRRAKLSPALEEVADPPSAEELQRQIRGFLESPIQEQQEVQSCPPCMTYIHPYMQ